MQAQTKSILKKFISVSSITNVFSRFHYIVDLPIYAKYWYNNILLYLICQQYRHHEYIELATIVIISFCVLSGNPQETLQIENMHDRLCAMHCRLPASVVCEKRLFPISPLRRRTHQINVAAKTAIRSQSELR